MSTMTLPFAELVGLLAIVLALGIGIGWAVERELVRRRREAWRAKSGVRERKPASVTKGRWVEKSPPATPTPTKATDQLEIVMSASFSAQPLLNRSEARVFRELDRFVLSCNPGWQVMAQVSLGEILRCKDPDAYRCINSKRVDLLLVDEECRPRHAIEYQGNGHHQSTAAARDAVKKEALRRADIGYHEVVGGQTTRAELRALVEKLVERPPETVE